MAGRRSLNPIDLDWFNVTYRSVVTWILGAVLVASGLGGWWYWSTFLEPARRAQHEILSATTRLAEAARIAGDARVEDTTENARVALLEARSAYDLRDYGTAIPAAIRSHQLSSRAIELHGGDGDEGAVVRFLRLEGDVKVKTAGEFAWRGADLGMRLRAGDQIKTASNASAQVLYFDGTRTTISAGSLLEIRALEEDPVTKVRRIHENLKTGEIRSQTQQKNVKGSTHRFSTKVAQAEAAGEGEYHIAYEQGRTRFSTFEGRPIDVSGGGKTVSLEAGERIDVAAQGRIGAKISIPVAPRLLVPQDQKVFTVHDGGFEEIALSWEDVPGARGYRLMISRDSLFARAAYDAERPEPRAVTDAPPGVYYWRVSTIGREGVESRFSTSRRFEVTAERIHDRGDTVPPDLEITDTVLNGSVLILTGRTEPGAVLWIDDEKTDVYENGRFHAVVRLRNEGWNELSVVAADAAGNESRVRHRAYLETF